MELRSFYWCTWLAQLTGHSICIPILGPNSVSVGLSTTATQTHCLESLVWCHQLGVVGMGGLGGDEVRNICRLSPGLGKLCTCPYRTTLVPGPISKAGTSSASSVKTFLALQEALQVFLQILLHASIWLWYQKSLSSPQSVSLSLFWSSWSLSGWTLLGVVVWLIITPLWQLLLIVYPWAISPLFFFC